MSYRKKHPVYHKNYYWEHVDEINAKQRARRLIESDRFHGYEKKWRGNNPEKVLQKTTERKRKPLRFIPLFLNPFPEEIKVDYHHSNDIIVIPMPGRLHKTCVNYSLVEHRKRANVVLMNIYGIDFDRLLSPPVGDR